MLVVVRWWVSLILLLVRVLMLGVCIVLFLNVFIFLYFKLLVRKIIMFGLKLSDLMGERRVVIIYWINILSFCMFIMLWRFVVICDIYIVYNNGFGIKLVFWCVYVFLCVIWYKWIWRFCFLLVCNNFYWIIRESKYV